jgi:sugar-specific transcriptional regulator TrmB
MNEKIIPLLKKLEFTIDEILVYLALLSSTGISAKEVSSLSKIPSSRIYSVMESLQKKGFVEIWPGKPTLFYSVPLEDALNNYMRMKEIQLRNELMEKPKKRKEIKVEVQKGATYLIKEEKPNFSFEIYRHLLESGSKGMCITRIPPEKAEKKYGINGNIFWLTHQAHEHPSKIQRLDEIMRKVREFIESEEDTVVLLDGLEYLITRYDFARVLKMAHDLNEIVSLYNSRLLIPLDPRTLEERELALLSREMEIFHTT